MMVTFCVQKGNDLLKKNKDTLTLSESLLGSATFADLAISVGLGIPSCVSTVSSIDETDDVALEIMFPQLPQPQPEEDGTDDDVVSALKREQRNCLDYVAFSNYEIKNKVL